MSHFIASPWPRRPASAFGPRPDDGDGLLHNAEANRRAPDGRAAVRRPPTEPASPTMTLASRLLLLVLVPVVVATVAALARVPTPALLALAAAAAVVSMFFAWRLAREMSRPLWALERAAVAWREDRVIDVDGTGVPECDAAITALAEASAALREREDAQAHEREAGQARALGVSSVQRLQVVGRLGSSIAHDFNNVLGVVSNSLLLLRRLPSVDAHQMPLGAIDRAVANGTRLVRQLQRLSRPASGASGPIDLHSYLEDIADVLKLVVGSSVRIGVVAEPGLPPVRVDAAEFELALVNLALNAREAMPSGGTLTLRARRATAAEAPGSGAWVVVSAEDSGEGVEPRLVDRIFERFFTTRPGHAGLGLAQVRDACRAAGGDVSVRPGARDGTEVRLVLPARVAAPADAPAAAARANGPTRAGRDRLLLVEDNTSLAKVTEALLALEGYEVVLARSAAEALDCVAQAGDRRFDVVLSDVVMPGEMDGLEMARQLRATQPALPIVLISGYSSSMAGGAGFEMLCKPYSPQDLTRLLRKVLGDGAAAARAA